MSAPAKLHAMAADQEAAPESRQAAATVVKCNAARIQLTADLLAEAVEIAAFHGAAILSEIRQGKYSEVIVSYRAFDAAVRCARQCAEELRRAHER